MTFPSTVQLRDAVAEIVPFVEARIVKGTHHKRMREKSLWREMVCCILSSQVRYPTAVAAARRIEAEGILSGSSPADQDSIQERVFRILAAPLDVGHPAARYRFPRVRAAQIGGAWALFQTQTLSGFLKSSDDSEHLRTQLVELVPGLGPKQASMFLRNIGITYELALLDRHVLRYMAAIGLSDGCPKTIASLSAYRRYEATLRMYSDDLGYRVGIVDWAIWIVMRAVGGLEQE